MAWPPFNCFLCLLGYLVPPCTHGHKTFVLGVCFLLGAFNLVLLSRYWWAQKHTSSPTTPSTRSFWISSGSYTASYSYRHQARLLLPVVSSFQNSCRLYMCCTTHAKICNWCLMHVCYTTHAKI